VRLVLQSLGTIMIDIIIGGIGLLLIVYLFFAVLKAEKF
jgi:K+-transporting ATPase KdpF subunit